MWIKRKECSFSLFAVKHAHRKDTYNLNGTVNKKILKNGTYVLLQYDHQNNLIQEDTYSSDGTSLRTLQYRYQGKNLVAKVDAMGEAAEYAYDGAGRKIAQISHGGDHLYREEYACDSLGRLALIKKWHGEKEEDYIQYITEYDNADRVIEKRIEDHAGNVCSRRCYVYDINDHCIEEVTYQEENSRSVQSTQYSSYHLPIKSCNALGYTTYFTYDFAHVDSFGQKVLKVTATDPKGVQTITVKDTHGRDISIQKYNASKVLLSSEQMAYDERGLKVAHAADAIVNGKSERQYQVVWTYDCMERSQAIVEDPLSKNKRTTMTYTSMGALRKQTQPNGVVLTCQYDSLGRKISLTSSDNSIHYLYTYDRNDRLLTSQDVLTGATLLRSYDPFGNLIAENLPNGYRVALEYDGHQRLTHLRLPDGSMVIYDYGPICMRSVTKVAPDGNKAYTHTYDDIDWEGRSRMSTLITGDKAYLEWDALGRLASMKTPRATESIPQDGYDPAGNLLHVHFSSAWGCGTEHFFYDDLNQLVHEEGVAAHGYRYDSLHNRLAQDEYPHVVNTLNQVERTKEETYAYDPNGNLTQERDAAYHYDALNRLKSVIKEREWRIEYAYDSFGRRMSIKRYRWEKGWCDEETSRFLYQGIHEIGSVNEVGGIDQLRIMGKREGAALRVAVAVELNGRVYAPLYDHRFNVMCLVDLSSKEPVESYRYLSFGEVVVYDAAGRKREMSAIGNCWLFGNQRYDRWTGLYNFGRRDYSPPLGRWISPDPGDFVDGLNLYAYTHNCPLTCTDFFGFQTVDLSNREADQNLVLRKLDYLATVGSSHLGCVVETAAHYLLPPSPVRNYAERLGRVLQGKPSYCSSSRMYSSVSGVVGEKAFPNAMVRYIPGNRTTTEEAIAQANRISRYLDNHQVHYTCHVTDGFMPDCVRAASELLYVPTHAIEHLQNDLINDYATMKKACGDNFRLHYVPHSRGGLEMYEASSGLTEEMRDNMSVHTFGSARVIPDKMFKFAENYQNPRDAVCMIANCLNYDNNANIINTGWYMGSPFTTAHTIQSEGYDINLRRICYDILKEESRQ
ncbi:MAG: RHS repeat-associated core domain-containing protein [Waddliaceae bacterium]